MQNRSLAVNYVSFVNANVSIVLSTGVIFDFIPFDIMQAWLSSYFLYDSFLVMTKPTKWKRIDGVFLLHHCLSLLTIRQTQYAPILTRLFLVAELSNWPMYVVKHYLENGNRAQLEVWKRIQLGVYAPLRIVGIGSFFLLVKDAMMMKIIGAPIYMMGIVWSYQLWNRL